MKTTVIRIERFGPPDVLVEREVSLEELGPTDVHLRVQAAGLNFADLMMRAGIYDSAPNLPFSPGFEVAGKVVRLGGQVEGWAVGDRAIGVIRHGGYAHDVVVPASNLFPCPDSISPVQAAAIPVVFLTAWVCLFQQGNAQPGQAVLILGAGGGVGTAAVQLAVRHEMRVIGTAGTERKRAFVVDELGAEACFDSRSDWEEHVRGVVGDRGLDLALDGVGGRATMASRRLLAPLGRLIFYGFSSAVPKQKRSWLRIGAAWLRTRPIHPLSLVIPNQGVLGVHLLHLGPKEPILRGAMKDILGDILSRELRPIVDRTFPLTREGAVDAHRHVHARRNLGKVVLTTEDGD